MLAAGTRGSHLKASVTHPAVFRSSTVVLVGWSFLSDSEWTARHSLTGNKEMSDKVSSIEPLALKLVGRAGQGGWGSEELMGRNGNRLGFIGSSLT